MSRSQAAEAFMDYAREHGIDVSLQSRVLDVMQYGYCVQFAVAWVRGFER